jgi:hypothetical protein
MSLGFEFSGLLQSVRQLEALAKARLAERRNEAEAVDVVRTQLMRYGVCTCPCHFAESTIHSGEPCCGNARVVMPLAQATTGKRLDRKRSE